MTATIESLKADVKCAQLRATSAEKSRDEWRDKAEVWAAWYSRPAGPWSLGVGGVWPSSEMTEYLDDRIRRERVEAWDEGFALGYWDGYNTGCPPGTEIEEHHGRTEAQSTWAQQNNPYRDEYGARENHVGDRIQRANKKRDEDEP